MPPAESQLARLQLVRRIGVGGMAEVFLARQRLAGGLQRNVVLKRILPEYADHAGFTRDFLNEAALTSRLEHASLVRVLDFGEENGTYFLIMEYLRGFDLEKIITLQNRRGQRLPVPVVLSIARDILLGLDYAHRATDEAGEPLGLVHRDVSPGNVMVTAEGHAKLVDFGVAKATAQAGNRTATGTVKGKAPYLAPEQIAGQTLDGRADLFALGTTLYEALSGTSPFLGATEFDTMCNIVEKNIAVLGGVPTELAAVIDKAMKRDRVERYGSASEMLAALEKIAVREGFIAVASAVKKFFQSVAPTLEAEQTIEAESAPTVLGTPRPRQRRHWGVFAALAAAPLLLAGFAWLHFRAAPQAVVPTRVDASPSIAQPALGAPLEAPATAPAEAPPSVVITKPARVNATKTPKHREEKKVNAPAVLSGEGTVRFVVQPWAQLQIDGRSVGDIPRPPEKLTAGPHTLVISNEQLGKRVKRKIEVVPNTEVLVRENFLEP